MPLKSEYHNGLVYNSIPKRSRQAWSTRRYLSKCRLRIVGIFQRGRSVYKFENFFDSCTSYPEWYKGHKASVKLVIGQRPKK